MKIPQGLTREEQETFFRTSAADDYWEFYSRDPKFKRLLERRGYTVKPVVSHESPVVSSDSKRETQNSELEFQGLWSCKIPRESLILRSASRKKRVLTDEAKAMIAEQ